MKRLLLTLTMLVSSTQLWAQFDGYIWPTDASQYLSSTFGETRSAHFHSGLDIKTWGREGYNVFASKSGKIVRMAITSQGYGRALYVQHEDSSFTVYAHLQRFIPELQSYIDSVRLLDHVFEIDIDASEKNWFFEQGEVIGYTGSTGVGPPHLHFEIRDKNERPVNALLSNLEITDSIAPKVSAVLVIPMSDSTLIEGSKFPRLYYPTENNEGILDLGLIKANGPVAIAINEYDQAENVTNRYASYEFRIISDSDTLFYSKHDEFDFDEASTMFIDRIAAYGAYRRSFQTLFNEEAVNVPFYKSATNRGILVPSETAKEFSILVNDYYNNSTSISFKLEKGTFHSSIEVLTNPDIYQWYWRNDWLTQHSLSSIDLTADDFGKNWDKNLSQRLGYFAGEEMLLTRIDQKRAISIFEPKRNLKVHFTANTFFDSTTVAIYLSEKEGMPSFSVMPFSTPIKQRYFVEYYLGEDIDPTQNYQVFHFDPFRDRYTHIPTQIIGNTIHARPEVLGEFVIFPDNQAPEMYNPVIIETDYKTYQVEIDVMDELSGINFEESEIQVNGIRGITEYDFEEDKLIYLHPNFKPESRNRIEVIVTDNAGNSRFEVFYL